VGTRAVVGVRRRPLNPGVANGRPLAIRGAVEVGGSRAGLRLGVGEPSFEPGRQERLKPGGDPAVVLEPAAEMLWAAQGAGAGQALGAAMGPAAHHVIGDLRVELEADRMAAVAIGLVGESRAPRGEELGPLGQIEAVGVPLIDAAREFGPAQPIAGGRRLDQTADGYVATIVSGEVIAENGAPTAARPGKLVRGRQPVPA